ncbi:MAG: L-threonylcarbamoyladenylate synthase [Actinomycetota bacterium]|nr:L-threonylcarbamoyladenylate synthase [Actinomycetota bacterium]
MSAPVAEGPGPGSGLEELAVVLRSGGVVALPTDTVYGLAADASDPRAAERVFALKGRPESVALPVLVADLEQAALLVERASHAALAALARSFWPGPLTVVAPRAAGARLELGGDGATVGVRCPAHGSVRSLCGLVGPLAVTSANRHGGPPCTSADEVRVVFGAALPVLDGGSCSGAPSTVVSLDRESGARLLRSGPVPLREVLEVLGAASR